MLPTHHGDAPPQSPSWNPGSHAGPSRLSSTSRGVSTPSKVSLSRPSLLLPCFRPHHLPPECQPWLPDCLSYLQPHSHTLLLLCPAAKCTGLFHKPHQGTPALYGCSSSSHSRQKVKDPRGSQEQALLSGCIWTHTPPVMGYVLGPRSLTSLSFIFPIYKAQVKIYIF